MRNNKDEFSRFQKYFKEYQHRFGLNGYRVYFQYEPIGDSFATLTAEQNHMVATVKLNSKLTEENKPFKDIRRSAKHEAIHLLIHKLEHRAYCRFVMDEEIYEATEELVIKLEDLID